MPADIDRDDVRRLIEQGAQIVEVLPPKEFEEDHIAGAISMPLRKIEEAREALDASRPVIVYCWDSA